MVLGKCLGSLFSRSSLCGPLRVDRDCQKEDVPTYFSPDANPGERWAAIQPQARLKRIQKNATKPKPRRANSLYLSMRKLRFGGSHPTVPLFKCLFSSAETRK
jgi:hypothetical protein